MKNRARKQAGLWKSFTRSHAQVTSIEASLAGRNAHTIRLADARGSSSNQKTERHLNNIRPCIIYKTSPQIPVSNLPLRIEISPVINRLVPPLHMFKQAEAEGFAPPVLVQRLVNAEFSLGMRSHACIGFRMLADACYDAISHEKAQYPSHHQRSAALEHPRFSQSED